MTKEEILAAAGYPNTPEGIAAFYNEYNTPDAFFAKHGGSLSGAPHDGQPTADQFFNYGSHVNDKLNVPMSNPFFLKQGGTYYGGPTRPYAYGGDISEFCWGGGLPGGPNEKPQMLHGGYHSPMNYGSFPVTSEYGGILDASNRDAFPMMEHGGTNLSKIIKAASKKIKKAYASGGNTTIQGGNQNFLENRNNAFTNSIKNNVYNAFIKEEEKAAMQALNPYATGMEQEDQEYPEARYGLSTYRKRGEKQPDDVPIDFRKALPDLFPVGRDYSQYIPANIQSQYFMSNADYAKMYDLNKRLADKSFQLNKDGFEGTAEYGPMARLLGKTGRKIFGPKSVTYKFTGRGVKQVPVKDTELNLPGFEKKVTSGTPTSLMDDYYNQGSTEYEDIAGISDIKNLPKEKEPQYKYRNLNRPAIYNEDGYGTEYEDRANYSDQYIQDQPIINKSDENIQLNSKSSIYDKINDIPDSTEEMLRQLRERGIRPEYRKSLIPYEEGQEPVVPFAYGGIFNYQTGGLTWEQYDDLKAQYAAAQQASLKNKRNDETLKFQQSFHSYEPTRQIAEGLLAERQAANQPTALGRTLGKDKMYSLASNEDKYFGNTTQQYLTELEKLKPKTPRETMQPRQVSLDTNFTGDIAQSSFIPQSTTTPAPTAQPKPQVNTLQASGTNLTDMNVQDSPVDLKSKTSTQQVNALQSSKPTMGNVNAGDTGLLDADKKAAIVNKAKNFPTGKLTPELNLDDKGKKELTGPTDTEVGPEETITSKIKRKTKGIGKAIGQYAPGAANAWASILEQQDKMEPMQNQPVVLGNRGDYDINTGDFRVHQKVPVQFPGGPGAYRMEYGGIPKALSGLEVKMRPGLYGTNGNRQFSLPTQVDSQKFAQQPTEVRNSLTAVPRDQANLEAEGGETAMININGIPAHFKISGKRHSQGGVPLDLPDNSFIFSDTASMRIKDPNVQKDFGLPIKKGGYTPAEIAKKYDINKFRKILSDPNSEDLERKTAEGMIANYNMKLAKLSLIQESMKGFPQGVPVVAMPYMMANNVDPSMYMPTQGQEEQPDEDMGVQRYGGNIVAQYPTMRYGGLPKAQKGLEAQLMQQYKKAQQSGDSAAMQRISKQMSDIALKQSMQQLSQSNFEGKNQEIPTEDNYTKDVLNAYDYLNTPTETSFWDFSGGFKDLGKAIGASSYTLPGYDPLLRHSAMKGVDRLSMENLVNNPTDYLFNLLTLGESGMNYALTNRFQPTGNLWTGAAIDPTTYAGVGEIARGGKLAYQAAKEVSDDALKYASKYGEKAYNVAKDLAKKGYTLTKEGIDWIIENAPKGYQWVAENFAKFYGTRAGKVASSLVNRAAAGSYQEQEKDKRNARVKAENQILKEELERIKQSPDAVTTRTTTPIVDIKKAKPAPVKPKATGNVKDAMDNMNRFAGYKQPMSYKQFRQGLPVYERPAAALPEIQSKPSAPVKDIEVKKKPQGSKQTKKVVEKPKKEEKIDWSQFKEQ